MSATAVLVGRVGRVGDLSTAAQSETLGFTVATNRRAKDPDGKWTDVPTWWACRSWGQQAAGLANRLRTGDEVEVTGEAYLEEWTGKDGEKRRDLKLSVRSCQILHHKRTDQPAAEPVPTPAPALVTPPVSPDHDQPPF